MNSNRTEHRRPVSQRPQSLYVTWDENDGLVDGIIFALPSAGARGVVIVCLPAGVESVSFRKAAERKAMAAFPPGRVLLVPTGTLASAEGELELILEALDAHGVDEACVVSRLPSIDSDSLDVRQRRRELAESVSGKYCLSFVDVCVADALAGATEGELRAAGHWYDDVLRMSEEGEFENVDAAQFASMIRRSRFPGLPAGERVAAPENQMRAGSSDVDIMRERVAGGWRDETVSMLKHFDPRRHDSVAGLQPRHIHRGPTIRDPVFVRAVLDEWKAGNGVAEPGEYLEFVRRADAAQRPVSLPLADFMEFFRFIVPSGAGGVEVYAEQARIIQSIRAHLPSATSTEPTSGEEWWANLVRFEIDRMLPLQKTSSETDKRFSARDPARTAWVMAVLTDVWSTSVEGVLRLVRPPDDEPWTPSRVDEFIAEVRSMSGYQKWLAARIERGYSGEYRDADRATVTSIRDSRSHAA